MMYGVVHWSGFKGDEQVGVTYEPFINDNCVGYKATRTDGTVRWVYLVPSEDGPTPDVFEYRSEVNPREDFGDAESWLDTFEDQTPDDSPSSGLAYQSDSTPETQPTHRIENTNMTDQPTDYTPSDDLEAWVLAVGDGDNRLGYQAVIPNVPGLPELIARVVSETWFTFENCDNEPVTVADYAADIVRVLSRDYLGTE